jgi:hypothetical protein
VTESDDEWIKHARKRSHELNLLHEKSPHTMTGMEWVEHKFYNTDDTPRLMLEREEYPTGILVHDGDKYDIMDDFTDDLDENPVVICTTLTLD